MRRTPTPTADLIINGIALPVNTRMAIPSNDGAFQPRIYRRKGAGKRSPRLLIKCGCCDKSVEIYYSDDDNLLEINGVLASRSDWSAILLPLLKEATAATR